MAEEAAAVDDRSKFEALLNRLRPRKSGSLWRDITQAAVLVVIVCALAVFAALHFVRPAPPNKITIASGPPGSRFNTVAQQYQKILAKNGITLKILATDGSLDNFHRLMSAKAGVDIALVQTGTAGSSDTGDLVSLGSVFYVPLTIFYRSPVALERLSQLSGRRIAIGPPGSGTRLLSLALLKANEIEETGPSQLLDLEGEAARSALVNQQVDAIFLMGDSAASATIREMLHTPGVRLFEFPQADAYIRRFHYLSKLDLPAGSFDLGENLPEKTINMLAPTAELLAHSNLHPALSDLLLEAATEVHGGASVLQNAGQFPTPLAHDLPISADAARYYKSGKSFSLRYLPFWVASLLDRAVVVVLPVILVVIPALRYLPVLYNWRVNGRISHRYRQLWALERQSLGTLSADKRTALIDRLAQIERSVISLKVPGSHAEQVFILRQHIKFVQENLLQRARDLDGVRAAAPPHSM